MSLVSELIMSIRFLKYMGWGMYVLQFGMTLTYSGLSESHWTRKVKHARDVELSWRVKENIVSTILGYVHLITCHSPQY